MPPLVCVESCTKYWTDTDWIELKWMLKKKIIHKLKINSDSFGDQSPWKKRAEKRVKTFSFSFFNTFLVAESNGMHHHPRQLSSSCHLELHRAYTWTGLCLKAKSSFGVSENCHVHSRSQLQTLCLFHSSSRRRKLESHADEFRGKTNSTIEA